MDRPVLFCENISLEYAQITHGIYLDFSYFTSGISLIDSTTLDVCDNRRIHSHKVFKDIAQRGKSSTGWFYGFKLHIVVNEIGEILSFFLTPGDTDDRDSKVIDILTKDLFGKLFGDKGYLSQPLFKKLYDRGIKLITKIKKNMKNKLIDMVNYGTCYIELTLDYLDDRYYIDDPSIKVVNGESEIDKLEKILLDYDNTEGTYKIVFRFYKWWHATCQHVAHDEWIQYKVFKDGSPSEMQGTMITFNQMPLSSYDANNHNWDEWVEIERLEATEKEDGYIKYKRECNYKKGWWATLGAHEPDYKTEVIPKLSTEDSKVTPTLTPALTPTPKPSAAPIGKIIFDPPSCDWRNLPQNVRVYVDGNKTMTQYDSDIRQYRYTVTVTDPDTLETTTETRVGSTYWGVEQDWTIDKLLVTGPLLDGDKIIDVGGTVTITKEGIGKLNACVYSWKPGTAKWVSGDPPRGSWF